MSLTSLIKRSATGIVYVALIVATLIFFNGIAFPFLCMLFTALGIYELHHLFNATVKDNNNVDNSAVKIIDIFSGLLLTSIVPVILIPFCAGNPIIALIGYGSALLMLFLLRLIVQLYLPDLNALRSLSCYSMSMVYVSVPLAILTLIYSIYGASVVLITFIMIWLNDTGAFCIGSMLGKRRLFERISPKKSWEGFWGGMFFSIASAFLFAYCPGPWKTGLTLGQLCILGAIVSIAATFGDLVESLIKRTVGVKDSGNLLPGHGGILDRIDSLLLVAPSVFVFLSVLYIFY